MKGAGTCGTGFPSKKRSEHYQSLCRSDEIHCIPTKIRLGVALHREDGADGGNRGERQEYLRHPMTR